jgi:nucleotide-binding universal stress UspA family protein
VEAKVVIGDPAEAILRWASDGNADLIVMTNDGGSGRRRWLMGGMAGKVLQASNVPILLVQAGISKEIAHDKWPHTTLVVLLDGSELVELALPHAKALARLWSSGEIIVSLVRVCEPVLLPLLAAPQIVVKWERMAREIMGNSRRSAGVYLDGIGKQVRETGLTVTAQVLEGQPD